jgi:hypothetical protein
MRGAWELQHIIPEVSKTTIHEAVREKLGYRKLCARWVPKILTITKRNWCASGKIQVGYIGPSALQPGPRAHRFPLVSSPTETSRWENSLRRWCGAREVMTWFKGQAADFYDSRIQKLVLRINVWTMRATMLKNKVMYRQFIVAFVN